MAQAQPLRTLPDALLRLPARGRNLGGAATWGEVLGSEPTLLWFLRPVT